MMEDLFLLAVYMGALGVILAVCGVLADCVLPHIPMVQRFLDTLPDWEDEDE